MRIACTLARNGYGAGVIDYPWPWFMAALDEFREHVEAVSNPTPEW